MCSQQGTLGFHSSSLWADNRSKDDTRYAFLEKTLIVSKIKSASSSGESVVSGANKALCSIHHWTLELSFCWLCGTVVMAIEGSSLWEKIVSWTWGFFCGRHWNGGFQDVYKSQNSLLYSNYFLSIFAWVQALISLKLYNDSDSLLLETYGNVTTVSWLEIMENSNLCLDCTPDWKEVSGRPKMLSDVFRYSAVQLWLHLSIKRHILHPNSWNSSTKHILILLEKKKLLTSK